MNIKIGAVILFDQIRVYFSLTDFVFLMHLHSYFKTHLQYFNFNFFTFLLIFYFKVILFVVEIIISVNEVSQVVMFIHIQLFLILHVNT